MSRTAALLSVLFVSAAVAAPNAQVIDGKIVVTGIASAKGLSVVVAEGSEEDIAARPAMTGEWTGGDGKFAFTPKYPLRAGSKYRVLGLDKGLDVETAKPPPEKPTVVKNVYPTGADVPENILRFYIEFSRPMPRGDAYKYIDVFTEKGTKVEWPFLVMDDEPWNADQTRLTLFIDPGRVKKEVKPRVDLGPVFVKDKKYTLVVSGKWPTLGGGTLGTDFRKPLTVTGPLSEGIDPKSWKVTTPVDLKGGLSVAFGRPLDHYLIRRSFVVVGPDGNPIAGAGEPTESGLAWTFRPAGEWAPGRYNLRVETTLEDVCGNRIGQPFEVDLLKPAPKEVKENYVDVAFTLSSR